MLAWNFRDQFFPRYCWSYSCILVSAKNQSIKTFWELTLAGPLSLIDAHAQPAPKLHCLPFPTALHDRTSSSLERKPLVVLYNHQVPVSALAVVAGSPATLKASVSIIWDFPKIVKLTAFKLSRRVLVLYEHQVCTPALAVVADSPASLKASVSIIFNIPKIVKLTDVKLFGLRILSRSDKPVILDRTSSLQIEFIEPATSFSSHSFPLKNYFYQVYKQSRASSSR